MKLLVLQATAQIGASVYPDKPEDVELAVLHDVRKTASRSAKLNERLKTVKGDVYQLEDDMRHL